MNRIVAPKGAFTTGAERGLASNLRNPCNLWLQSSKIRHIGSDPPAIPEQRHGYS